MYKMNLTLAPCSFNYMYRTLSIELLERIVIPFFNLFEHTIRVGFDNAVKCNMCIDV